MLSELTRTVAGGQSLSGEQIPRAVAALVSEAIDPVEKADFLTALAAKGETAEEIAGFARELLDRSIPVPFPDGFRESREVLDVCGTGGDRLNTFNISTTVALVCAAAGVAVAKHGNRAITSKSGSADVLEALGIPVTLSPEEAARSIVDHGFAFLFAPVFHPAFKGIGPARTLCAQRGTRTLFNFLGPLVNPARPTAQLLGVSRSELVEPMAQTLQSLGLRRAMVVSGDVPGHGTLDELSTLGINRVSEFYHDRALSTSEWSPRDFPVAPASLTDLAGGGREENAALIRGLLSGVDCGPRRDAVLLNASAALFVAGRVRSMVEGWDLALAVLSDGRAARKLRDLSRS
jgi:anthranilate phosphoribosyltransferase